MARSRKPFPGMGLHVLILDYDGTWVAHKGANTVEPLKAERRRLPQWPERKVRIVLNERCAQCDVPYHLHGPGDGLSECPGDFTA